MRILYVWDADYPWDVRTEKVCLALAEGGHQIAIAARNLKGQQRTETRPEGTVERMPAGPSPIRRWLSFPAFFNPVWLSHLKRMIRKHDVQLVVVRDLPLAPTALLAAGKRAPVILDMAENYPAMIRDIWTDGRQRPLDVMVRNPAMVAAVERATIGRLDHIITVVEESKDRIVRLGIPDERVSVVSNTPPKGRVTPPRSRRPGEPLRLVYLGLMEKHRGIGAMLDAAAALRQKDVGFHLDLIGDGRDFDQFRSYADGLGLTTDDVTFSGRLPHAEAIAMVGRAHVGLVPHEARESWNTTIPNKLFDYMAAGLAVISSDAEPAARVVRTTGAGFVFRSGEARELAEMIERCVNVEVWTRCSRAGQHAVETRYNWETDTMMLLDIVARVARENSIPS